MTLLKITLFGVMQCVYAFMRFKKHIIFHILYIIVAPLLRLSETFVASSRDIITDYNDLYCLFSFTMKQRHTAAATILQRE